MAEGVARLPVLGQLRIADYLKQSRGEVRGRVVTDAKDRYYSQDYKWSEEDERLIVQRSDGTGDAVALPKVVDLDEALVAFFGLYSGDGAKGTGARDDPAHLIPSISFSQREPHLVVRFAVDQFRRLFPGQLRFTFSLGEDSAFFMDENGLKLLAKHYASKGVSPLPPPGLPGQLGPGAQDSLCRVFLERRLRQPSSCAALTGRALRRPRKRAGPIDAPAPDRCSSRWD